MRDLQRDIRISNRTTIRGLITMLGLGFIGLTGAEDFEFRDLGFREIAGM